MLKFSKANAKIEKLSEVAGIKPFLANKRKVYSFDLLSGWSCPFAKDCLSKVHKVDGKFKLVDGPSTQFRCFSASQEVIYPNVYNSRENNFNNLRGLNSDDIEAMIAENMPTNLGVCRIHVAGDFFSPNYFRAWVNVAKNNTDRLFYAYTKSLPYWVQNLGQIPYNFVLTASYGGRCDDLIKEYGLRSSLVVFSESEAVGAGLDIDHDDSHAADPTKRENSFALLIHGVQPKGSEASEAVKKLRVDGVKFSYSRKKVS